MILINFSSDRGALDVTIETQHLILRSVKAEESYYNDYAALFGNSNAMKKYGNGSPKTREEIVKRINEEWVKLWQSNDPYSAFAVFKKHSEKFVGHAILQRTGEPGTLELAVLLREEYQGKGYGNELAHASVNEYALAAVKKGYFEECTISVYLEPSSLSPFSQVYA